MLRLIKAEIYKLFKTKTFRVLCVVALLIGFVIAGLAKLTSSEDFIKSSLKGMTAKEQQQFIDQLQASSKEDAPVVTAGGGMGVHFASKDMFHPTAKELFHGTFGSSIIEILLAVLIGAMVAREYSSGTIKNILAYGKKREHYYISKTIAITIGMIIILGIMVAVSTIVCTIMFGWGTDFDINQAAGILKTFGAAVIVGMAVISLIMLLATLLKSNGSTIGIGIVIFTILPSVLSFLYGKFAWFDKIFEGTPSYNWALVTSIRSGNGDIMKGITISLATLVVASACGIIIFKRQDIK